MLTKILDNHIKVCSPIFNQLQCCNYNPLSYDKTCLSSLLTRSVVLAGRVEVISEITLLFNVV